MVALSHSTAARRTLQPMAAKLAGVVTAALGAIGRMLANRAAVRQLAEADDHMLRDIGLCRSEVDAALRAAPFLDPGKAVKAFAERRCA
jgi:uncharacterized protein YjiS (DUF1127 family)